jgi:hypothetical protein
MCRARDTRIDLYSVTRVQIAGGWIHWNPEAFVVSTRAYAPAAHITYVVRVSMHLEHELHSVVGESALLKVQLRWAAAQLLWDLPLDLLCSSLYAVHNYSAGIALYTSSLHIQHSRACGSQCLWLAWHPPQVNRAVRCQCEVCSHQHAARLVSC